MQNGKRCLKCGKAKADSAFFKSSNENHIDGLIPICKSCICDAIYDPISDTLNMEQFQKILRQIDKPFLPKLINTAVKELQNRNNSKTGKSYYDSLIRLYFKYLTSLQQYKNYTWENSVFEGVDIIKKPEGMIKMNKQQFAILLFNYLQSQYRFDSEIKQNLLKLYVTFRVEAEQAIIDNDIERFLRCRNIIRFTMNRLSVMRGLDEHKQFYDYFNDWVYDSEQMEEVWNSPEDEFEIGKMFHGWDGWDDLWDFTKTVE